MVWFLFANDELHSNYPGDLGNGFREQLLERYFTPAPAETMVVLIGKDGGVKSRSPDLDLEATFGLIDQMPMRKAEMRRAGVVPHPLGFLVPSTAPSAYWRTGRCRLPILGSQALPTPFRLFQVHGWELNGDQLPSQVSGA